jgi:hypothetical protein
MTKLKINVTKENILNGTKCSGSHCAIAIAIKDIFPNAWVCQKYMRTDVANYKEIIYLSEEVVSFINRFDRATTEDRELINPISFEINIPDSVIEKINIDEIRESLINHPNLELC